MGRRNDDQGSLFYEFHLDEVVPDDHLVRKIASVLDLSWVHAELAPEAGFLLPRHAGRNAGKSVCGHSGRRTSSTLSRNSRPRPRRLQSLRMARPNSADLLSASGGGAGQAGAGRRLV